MRYPTRASEQVNRRPAVPSPALHSYIAIGKTRATERDRKNASCPLKADIRAARYHHGCTWLTWRRDGTVNCRSGDYAAAMVAGGRQFHGSSAFRSRFLARPDTIRCSTSVR